MSSFILRLKNLEYLTARFSKFTAADSCGNFNRTLHTSYILFSNITKHFIIHDLRDSAQPSKNEDFGKIVDLDCDFDQLRVDDDDFAQSHNPSKKTAFQEQKEGRRNIKKMRWVGSSLKTEVKEVPLDRTDCECENEPESHQVETKSQNDEVEKQTYKLSVDHGEVFRTLMMQFKSKKLRNKKQKVILEGKRLIQDAISAGHKPLKIFFSRFSDLRTLNIPKEVEVIQVPYETLNLWSDVVTSQGVIGVFRTPKLKSEVCSDNIPLTVLCDNVRDPGNLGSIMRIVAAVGAEELLLTTGCADIWDPKVLRAGAGAHFRLSVTNNLSWSDIENKIPDGAQIVLADSAVHTDSNETSEADKKIQSSLFKTSSELASNLPLYCYTSLEYMDQGAVIVLGGETRGLSDEAYHFAINRNGSRVYIPMDNGTESLNNAVSLGIISYEFRRQISLRSNTETPDEITSEDDPALEKAQ